MKQWPTAHPIIETVRLQVPVLEGVSDRGNFLFWWSLNCHVLLFTTGEFRNGTIAGIHLSIWIELTNPRSTTVGISMSFRVVQIAIEPELPVWSSSTWEFRWLCKFVVSLQMDSYRTTKSRCYRWEFFLCHYNRQHFSRWSHSCTPP